MVKPVSTTGSLGEKTTPLRETSGVRSETRYPRPNDVNRLWCPVGTEGEREWWRKGNDRTP